MMSGSHPSKYRVWVAVREREEKFPHPKERFHWQIIVEDADEGTGMFKECHTFEQHPYQRGGVPEILEDFPTLVSTKLMAEYDAVIEVARFQPGCLNDILRMLEGFKVNEYLPPGSSCKTFVRVVVTELKNKPGRYGVLLSKDFETAAKELTAEVGPLQINEEPSATANRSESKKFSFKRSKEKKDKSPESKERRISPRSLAQMFLPDKKDQDVDATNKMRPSRKKPTRRRTDGDRPSIGRPQQNNDDFQSQRGRQEIKFGEKILSNDPRRAASTPARILREPSARPSRPPRPEQIDTAPQIPPLEEFRFDTESISGTTAQRQRPRSRSRGRPARASSRDPHQTRQRSRQHSQRSGSRRRDITPGPQSKPPYQRRKIQESNQEEKIVVASPSTQSLNKALPTPVLDEKIPVSTTTMTTSAATGLSTTNQVKPVMNYSRRPAPPLKSHTELQIPLRVIQEMSALSPRRGSEPSNELPTLQPNHLRLLGGLNSAYSPIRAMG